MAFRNRNFWWWFLLRRRRERQFTVTHPFLEVANGASTVSDVHVGNIRYEDGRVGHTTFALSGGDSASLRVVADRVYIKSGTVINSAVKASYTATITMSNTAREHTLTAPLNIDVV